MFVLISCMRSVYETDRAPMLEQLAKKKEYKSAKD